MKTDKQKAYWQGVGKAKKDIANKKAKEISFKIMTIKERCYYTLWCICKAIAKPINFVGNYSADKLNKSFTKVK